MSLQLQLAGQKFGYLTAVCPNGKYISPTGRTLILWKCVCICGKNVNVRGTYLKNKLTKSCGCINKSRKSHGEANFNSIYYHYKRRSLKANRIFNISKDEFKNITKKDCYYCGQIPSTVTHTQNKGINTGYYVYNGIDRIDSSKGYIINNIVSCCPNCNYAKSDLTKNEFFDMIKRIYERHLNEK